MPRFPNGMQQSNQVAAAKSFARSFNILLKYARLYGVSHKQTTAQLQTAWREIQSAAKGDSGLLLGLAGGKVLVDGAPLEMGLAERSFAQMLSAAGVASLQFLPSATPDDFERLLRAFTVSKPATLLATVQKELKADGGIHVNAVRFVVEHAETESAVMQELTARALSKVDGIQDWLKDPEKLIQLITAAEGQNKTPDGSETGSSNGQPIGQGAGTGAGTGGIGAAEFQAVMRVLESMVSAQNKGDSGAIGEVHRKISGLPSSTEESLQHALAMMAAQVDTGQKIDGAVMLKLAEHLAIRFALDSYERGDIRVNAVREMLERLSSETERLRKILGAHEDKMERAGLVYETHADILDRQFWAAVPERGKRGVLLSPEAYCIPARNIRQYVEELLRNEDRVTPVEILRQYLECIRSGEEEARHRVAIGISEIADVYASLDVTLLGAAIETVSRQLLEERVSDLQPLVGAAFVRLSQEATSRHDYVALEKALARAREVEQKRPIIGRDIRPRIAVENRLREFLENVLGDEAIPDGFIDVLRSSHRAALEEIVVQFGRCTRREQCERLVQMTDALGEEAAQQLMSNLLNGSAADSIGTVGLLSRLRPEALIQELPKRVKGWSRYHQDAVVRQIAAACATGKHDLLASLLPAFDALIVPQALEELAVCDQPGARKKLLNLACGDDEAIESPYLQVRSIEIIGRLRDVSAMPELLSLFSDRSLFGWHHAREVRIAAAQALLRTDSSLIRRKLDQSDITRAELELGPLEFSPTDNWVRQRRYARITPSRAIAANANTPNGRCKLELKRLSLGGGLATCERRIPTSTEIMLDLPVGFKRCRSLVLVRELRGREVSFEILDIKLEDRSRLRQLLTQELQQEMPAIISSRFRTAAL